MRVTGDVAIKRGGEIGVGKHEGKRAFGRRRRRCEDELKWVSRSEMCACTGFIWLCIGTEGGLCD